LQSSNIGERLRRFGVEPRRFGRFPSGRLGGGARGIYGTVHGFSLLAERPPFGSEDRADLLSAAGKLTRSRWSLIGIAQKLDRSAWGAAPGVAPEATLSAKETFRLGSARWTGSDWQAAIGAAVARRDAPFTGVTSSRVDLSRDEVSAAPPRSGASERSRVSARVDSHRSWGRHRLLAGVEWNRGHIQETASVPGGLHRLFVDGNAHAVSLFSGSGETELAATRLGLHVADRFPLGSRLLLSPGLRWDVSRSGPIRWSSLAPSAGFELTLDARASLTLHGSLGRYPHQITTLWPAAAAPGGLSFVWHAWDDSDGDGEPQPQELGRPLRRGGPAFTSIDPDLPRPSTDELTVGLTKRFSWGSLAVGGYHRRERNLLRLVNVGVRAASYVSFTLADVGADGVFGTRDDAVLALFDQREQLGEDRYELTHPPDPDGFSQGLELILQWRSERLAFALAGRAYRDVGDAPFGNGSLENDPGLLGGGFVDPNAQIQARGRLFFDRAFTGKLLVFARGPRGFDLAAAIRYWDGQPFARHLLLSGLGQGFIRVQAFPRGTLRYTFNMTADLRARREFALGKATLGATIDVFNALNQSLETGEVVRSGENFRQTTAVQPGRTLRLSLDLRF
jgi:hypothetical protein